MRSEEGCEERGGIVGVAVVVVPVVVQLDPAVIPDRVHRIAVAVRTAHCCAMRLPLHCPLNTLGTVSNS